MREKIIEQLLSKECKARDILCYKFVSPNHRGVPDRLLIFNGHVCFVELKAPEGRLSQFQTRTINTIRSEGVAVHVIASAREVMSLVEEIAPD
jgi:hypothetical protein